MARKTAPAVPTRREPRQARAVDTVQTIFEVVAEIIETDGVEALNTNRIAEQAGIAIGTLYGYFPNKGAILLAMARRELQETQRAIRAAVDAADPGLDSSRGAIRALLRGFGGRNRLRRVLLEAVVAHGRYVELAQPVEDLAHAILDRGGKGLFPRLPSGLTEIQAFVLTRALVGVIRAAVFEESAFMGSSALEDELVRLTRGYITALTQANA
jgi:AcrR family transcriptional regulator